MNKVTKESLARRIMGLENQQRVFGLAINEEYQLEAYRMLLEMMPDGEHEHKWLDVAYFGCKTSEQVCECGVRRVINND